jgi:hypothetical protein
MTSNNTGKISQLNYNLNKKQCQSCLSFVLNPQSRRHNTFGQIYISTVTRIANKGRTE